MDSERARLASPGVAWEAAFQAMAASFATDTAAVGERGRLAADEPAGVRVLVLGHAVGRYSTAHLP
ncbi:MAG TPA: hypothetical protein VFU88_04355 [Ktedonobacterales bacterium]|nr:hypothetical protein [Ktedonobacterales bacterium]